MSLRSRVKVSAARARAGLDGAGVFVAQCVEAGGGQRLFLATEALQPATLWFYPFAGGEGSGAEHERRLNLATWRTDPFTLQMDYLSCKSPDNLECEIRMHFLVHNLVRRLMLEGPFNVMLGSLGWGIVFRFYY